MLFNSLDFLFLYLPATLAGFFLLGRLSRDAALLWLAAASLAFYGWDDPGRLLPIILASTAGNFVAARLIARRPGLLPWAVAANLAALGYYKYAGFLTGMVSDARVEVALPIGISFFTFTQIAFLVDVRRGLAAEYQAHKYALFVSYFPHLVAGPILHHREMMPQFDDPRVFRFDPHAFALGASWFGAGLFKKAIMADGVAPYVAPAFNAAAGGGPVGAADAWLGAALYAMQIYFDFSGYSDMAVGLALLVGIRLPLNFASPYQAASMIEFWRRWHMTLSRFLRDYLYIPLGGNRRGPARRYLNLLATMVLGGLWHGAAWTFVAWGAVHGLALAVNHLWRERGWGLPPGAGRTLTLAVVVLAWVPFRADGMDAALALWRAMLGPEGWTALRLAGPTQLAWLAATAAIALFAPNTQTILATRWRPEPRWALAAGSALGIGLGAVLVGSASEFLYFRF